MTDDLLIRPIAAEEVEPIVRLWRRSREHAQPWLEARLGHSPEGDLRHFREVIAPTCAVWVATRGETLLGFLAVHEGHVDYLYVDPPAQSRGVGTALLRKSKNLMPTGFTLFTHQRNAGARAFYEARGLRAVAFGMSPPPENEPDVKYAWSPPAPLQGLDALGANSESTRRHRPR